MKTNLWSSIFYSLFNEKIGESFVVDSDNGISFTDHVISYMCCTEADVAKLLQSFDADKACEPDKVSSRIFEGMSAELVRSPLHARVGQK